MEENKQGRNEQQVGEQNPTLNAPGSKVADYGNPEGGSGTEDAASQRETDRADRSKVEPLRGKDGTTGTP